MTPAGSVDSQTGSSLGVEGEARVVLAPAKVNLSLLVGPPQEDGYHPLSTVFVPLDLADSLEVRLQAWARLGSGGPPSSFEVSCPGVAHEENLVTRALRALENETGWVFSGKLAVHKEIPKGAGLGGGSSDAAAALRTGAGLIAEAGGPRVASRDLHRLARALGADVPFFLEPRPALAGGVGDVLEPLALPPLPLVLLLPTSELSTAEVYRTFDGVATREPLSAFRERRLRTERAWRTVSAGYEGGSLDGHSIGFEIARLLTNDLEMASLHLLPELAIFRGELDGEDVIGSLMSGSGPTLFGLCASNAAAETVAARLRARGFGARAATSVEGPTG
jgi:4-diphosphocytidyl-2-C-methyl-D-erythritol kinase